MNRQALRDWIPPAVVHFTKLGLRPEYRQAHKIASAARKWPRHVVGEVSIDGIGFEFVDGPSFANSYLDIFLAKPYMFATSSDRPLIVDGGANIGLSVLFFKRQHPRARVVAIEADPHIFKTLKKNCTTANLSNVTLIDRALWNRDEEILQFLNRGGEVGRLSHDTDQEAGVSVLTCRLSRFLAEPVDLLKLDVEGAETAVLRECEHVLGNVRNIILESHSFEGQDQDLAEHASILRRAGFRLHVHALQPASRPLIERPVRHGMDCQVNLFGFRP